MQIDIPSKSASEPYWIYSSTLGFRIGAGETTSLAVTASVASPNSPHLLLSPFEEVQIVDVSMWMGAREGMVYSRRSIGVWS